jgi:hypothetical protein
MAIAVGLGHEACDARRHVAFHPLDGARYLASDGQARLAALAAHNAGAE